MNSPFALLFLAIQQKIASLVDGNGKPYFNFIDQELGQMEYHNGDNRPPVLWPCVLIDIEDADFENIGENAQTGVLRLCLRIGFPPFSATSAATPAPYKNKALEYYNLEYNLHQAMQGWSPDTVTVDDTTNPVTTADLSNIYGHMIRIKAMTEQRSDMIRVRAITYTLSMDDYSTEDTVTYVPATLNLTDEITV